MTTSDEMDDAQFPGYVAERLSSVPGVMAVALGGSRAAGTQRPDSDWDFALYYRGRFEPQDLRALGWPGEISRIGGWGGGVFNGGPWLRADGRPVDVNYRDLDEVEWHLAEAIAGRFRIERLLFHLAGVPTYIVVAELAVNVVLYGGLPSPGGYPDRLRQAAHERWRADARHTLGSARRVDHQREGAARPGRVPAGGRGARRPDRGPAVPGGGRRRRVGPYRGDGRVTTLAGARTVMR
jgi:predicted nucleotidyltransferase